MVGGVANFAVKPGCGTWPAKPGPSGSRPHRGPLGPANPRIGCSRRRSRAGDPVQTESQPLPRRPTLHRGYRPVGLLHQSCAPAGRTVSGTRGRARRDPVTTRLSAYFSGSRRSAGRDLGGRFGALVGSLPGPSGRTGVRRVNIGHDRLSNTEVVVSHCEDPSDDDDQGESGRDRCPVFADEGDRAPVHRRPERPASLGSVRGLRAFGAGLLIRHRPMVREAPELGSLLATSRQRRRVSRLWRFSGERVPDRLGARHPAGATRTPAAGRARSRAGRSGSPDLDRLREISVQPGRPSARCHPRPEATL